MLEGRLNDSTAVSNVRPEQPQKADVRSSASE